MEMASLRERSTRGGALCALGAMARLRALCAALPLSLKKRAMQRFALAAPAQRIQRDCLFAAEVYASARRATVRCECMGVTLQQRAVLMRVSQ